MSDKEPKTPSEDLQRIIDSAQRLGVEINESDAIQWLTAIASIQSDTDITIDIHSGIYGHQITLLDFNPEDLEHFRVIGELVGFEDQPGVVETALALSGSAAQSKIQTYPGDADYFERVNIIADTKEEACRILGETMRGKALATLKGPTYELIEVKLGNYPKDVIRGQTTKPAGSPISWNAREIQTGVINVTRPDGTPAEITWEEAAQDPGWCKLDWVVADPVRKKLVNASNMLDATWESPGGEIIPLDGYLDPYFQEVYLEAESIPIFTKLAKEVSSDAMGDYVAQLEGEVKKYLTKNLNYGKAAKRMYNIFRLTGRYEEAAFLRELFDEPTTVLYQVWSLIRTIDDSFQLDSSIELDTMLAQADELILTVSKYMEGEHEVEIIRLLLRLRDILSREKDFNQLSPPAEAARAEVINVVNNFFYEKLTGIPSIKLYMEDMKQS
jgi:hypothetical protein